MKPQLSIIIPTWNTAKITQKNVDLLIKKLPINFAEIIVVDNHSTDQTTQIFKSYSQVIYHQNQDNLGFSKANNIGAKLASADHLLFLNSDMEMTHNNLTEMLEYYRQNPQIGIIGPKFLNPDSSVQGSVFPPQTPINAIKEYWFKQKSYSKYAPDVSQPTPVWAISGGAVLISKKIFKEIKGWNEEYFMYFEDLDLCRKIRNIKKLVYYYPHQQFIHQHGASGKGIVDSSNQWRRLIPGSIKYHGVIEHYLLYIIIRLSQLWSKK